MSLFKKNPNEAAYYEGKKHFIDVIKNSGDNSFLILLYGIFFIFPTKNRIKR